MTHNREAERLRIILETFRYAHPAMTLEEAVPMIWEAEKRTAELESKQSAALSGNTDGTWTLANNEPETIASWIDTQPDIQDFIAGSQKINAIRETRTRLKDPVAGRGTHVGLKDAKYGVEEWERRYRTLPF